MMKETIGGTQRMSASKEREMYRPTWASGSERDRPTYPTGCPIFGRFRPVVAGIGLLFSSGLFRRISCQLPGYSELYARYEKFTEEEEQEEGKGEEEET
jgi:hypothetical protein